MKIISKLKNDLEFKFPLTSYEHVKNNVVSIKTSSEASVVAFRSPFQINVLNDNKEQAIFGLDLTLGRYHLHAQPNISPSLKSVKIINVPWVENYGHCLHDVLPKLLWEDKDEECEKIYTCNSPLLSSLVALFEIDFKKVCPLNKSIQINAENIIVENHTACHLRNKAKIAILKRQIDKIIKTKYITKINNRLIYCSRNGTNVTHGRKMELENEKDIICILQNYCFEHNLLFTFFNGQENGETMSHLNQLKLFSEAKIVVGPHGSAMANVIYLNPDNNCSVCEFTSGHEVVVQSGTFSNHYNFLYGFLPEELYNYCLIPFHKDSTNKATKIDLINLKAFLSQCK